MHLCFWSCIYMNHIQYWHGDVPLTKEPNSSKYHFLLLKVNIVYLTASEVVVSVAKFLKYTMSKYHQNPLRVILNIMSFYIIQNVKILIGRTLMGPSTNFGVNLDYKKSLKIYWWDKFLIQNDRKKYKILKILWHYV